MGTTTNSFRRPYWCPEFVTLMTLCCGALGCGGPGRLDAPDWDPAQAATDALELYDADSDGLLAGPELDKCPAMKKALAEIDKDGDGKLSHEEIEARIQGFVDSKLARMTFACVVARGGRRLSGVDVTFEPEPFLADVIQPATGTTGANGLVSLSIEGVSSPGVNLGFYKVRISRKDPSGKETLPAKYNTETILGQELALGSRALSMGQVIFNLQ